MTRTSSTTTDDSVVASSTGLDSAGFSEVSSARSIHPTDPAIVTTTAIAAAHPRRRRGEPELLCEPFA
ncbi:MAG: hypothetical protein OES25_01370 [Acidobacteriota bacterium]|nr:hypothetical protein [Acidobacteriota bacterium]